MNAATEAPQFLDYRPASTTIDADIAWLREHGAEYAGEWVVLKAGIMVAHATTVGELKTMVESFAGLFVTHLL